MKKKIAVYFWLPCNFSKSIEERQDLEGVDFQSPADRTYKLLTHCEMMFKDSINSCTLN